MRDGKARKGRNYKVSRQRGQLVYYPPPMAQYFAPLGGSTYKVRFMSDQDLLRVLEEIRDNQKLQLERQAHALELQREQFSLVQKQFERAESIQDRAEQIQAKGCTTRSWRVRPWRLSCL